MNHRHAIDTRHRPLVILGGTWCAYLLRNRIVRVTLPIVIARQGGQYHRRIDKTVTITVSAHGGRTARYEARHEAE